MAKLGDAPGWDKLGAGGPQPKCQACGRPLKDAKFSLCYECNQKKKEASGAAQDVCLPDQCFFKTFYGENKFLKREIFLESAELASKEFMRAGISQNSLRNLFHPLKDMSCRLKADRKLDFGAAQEAFYRFVVQVDYNVKRQVIHPVLQNFASNHVDTATKSREEFIGFVEYLTSILARLKTK